MDELMALRRAGRQLRPFGAKYMALRQLTEARLRALFIDAGGSPDRAAPHYFVLGESPWFEHLAERMDKLQLPLSDLPADKTSVTYPDSFAAMEFGHEFGITQQSKPYHGQVFLLADLPELVERYGIPSPAWRSEYREWTTWPEATYIEVQLWSDQPVRPYLG
jgi:hypothetical protein